MGELVKMVVVLTIITACSGLGLSGLNEATKDIIRQTELKEVYEPSLKALVEGYENDPVKDAIEFSAGKDNKGKDIMLTVFPCKKGGKLFAVAFDQKANGFGGEMKVMLAVDTEQDTLMGVRILTHVETKGVGTDKEAPFIAQFGGQKEPDKATIKQMDGPLDAMSGATYSSTGVSTAAKNGLTFYIKDKQKLLGAIK